MSDSTKMIAFGLDGATFEVIKREIDQLPTFRRLIDKGVHGNLESTVPMHTAVAWPAFATGKNPGKNGIFDYMMRDAHKEEFHIIDFGKLSFDCFWKYAKGKVGLASIPAIPFQRVNGFFIQGSFLLVSTTDVAIIEGKKYALPEYYDYQSRWEDGEDRILAGLKKETDARINFFKYLVKKCNPDLAVLYFDAVDEVQHHFWAYWDKQHPLYKESKYEHSVIDLYMQIDRGIGEILKLVDDDCYVMIFSDHGFGPCHSTFYINDWLNKENYLKYNEGREKERSPHSFQKKVYQIIVKFRLMDFVPSLLKKRILGSYFPAIFKVTVGGVEKIIDWSETKAFAILRGCGGPIYINLGSGGEKGIVTKERYDLIREEIARKLVEVKDPRTGEKVVEKVFKKEEIYHGPFLERAPDLVAAPRRGYILSSELRGSSVFSRKTQIIPFSGTHRPEGIFIACGPGIRRGLGIEGARIYDVAPTILHIFGASIPEDMDGRVLTGIFEEDSDLRKREIRYRETGGAEKDLEPVLKGEEIIRERLRNLGYIEE